MPITLQEISSRALAFSREWKHAESEDADAVDAAYVPDGGKRRWSSDAERVAFLFRRYREIVSLLPEN